MTSAVLEHHTPRPDKHAPDDSARPTGLRRILNSQLDQVVGEGVVYELDAVG